MTILMPLGRLLRSTKRHLAEIAPMLSLPADATQRMRGVSDEEGEAILLSEIAGAVATRSTGVRGPATSTIP